MSSGYRTSVKDWDAHMDEWALPVGRFMVSFTNLEFWTNLCIQVFGSFELRGACLELALEQRVKIAESLALKHASTDDQRQRVTALFVEVRRLAGQRNLVAHNPPMAHVYMSDQGDVRVEKELRSLRKHERHVTKRELAALHKAAIAAGDTMHELLKELSPRA